MQMPCTTQNTKPFTEDLPCSKQLQEERKQIALSRIRTARLTDNGRGPPVVYK